jgi:hypothetical protein
MRFETKVVGPTTHSARPMARAQGRGLVKKEQLGIFSWLHEGFPAPVFIGKPARYPRPNPPIANDTALRVVEQSSITHPARGCTHRMNGPSRVDSIRQRHLEILASYGMLFTCSGHAAEHFAAFRKALSGRTQASLD